MRRVVLWAVIAFATLGTANSWAQRTVTARAGRERVTPSSPVKARLWMERGIRNTRLVGRTDTHILLVPDAGGAASERVEIATLRAAAFDISYDRSAVAEARRENRWTSAIKIQQDAYRSTFLYLDLPNNNALEGAFDLATDMWHAARYTERRAGSDEAKALARRQYEAALELYERCAKAEWSAIGLLAQMKVYRCLIALDKARNAWLQISTMEPPLVGDAIYGHYWLVEAEMHMVTNGYRQAMDAAVKSLAFETKDIECFPDALLMTANCYAKLDEPYRARDVYFEIAKLFPDTDWRIEALQGLIRLKRSGLVAEKEEATVERVFFATDEDMNELVDGLLKEIQDKIEKK